jgi:hypothetical protein
MERGKDGAEQQEANNQGGIFAVFHAFSSCFPK